MTDSILKRDATQESHIGKRGFDLLAIVAIACLGAWLYQRLRPFTPEERSIAVLPFENLSSDKENAYFAEGIQDEILTRLIQDRRSEGDLAHFHTTLSKRAEKLA